MLPPSLTVIYPCQPQLIPTLSNCVTRVPIDQNILNPEVGLTLSVKFAPHLNKSISLHNLPKHPAWSNYPHYDSIFFLPHTNYAFSKTVNVFFSNLKKKYSSNTKKMKRSQPFYNDQYNGKKQGRNEVRAVCLRLKAWVQRWKYISI